MLIETVVGERRAGSGVQTDGRGGAYGEIIVNDLGLGRFYEAARLGRIFSAATAIGATLNANATPLAAAGTPPWALYNPKGNQRAAVILKATCLMAEGASAAPIMPVWEYRATVEGLTAAGGAAALSGVIGLGANSTMKTFIAAALTGATVASALLRPWEGNVADPRHLAAASETGIAVITEDTDGRIIVPPGALLDVMFNVAGAAVTGCISVTWAEIDWPL